MRGMGEEGGQSLGPAPCLVVVTFGCSHLVCPPHTPTFGFEKEFEFECMHRAAWYRLAIAAEDEGVLTHVADMLRSQVWGECGFPGDGRPRSWGKGGEAPG